MRFIPQSHRMLRINRKRVSSHFLRSLNIWKAHVWVLVRAVLPLGVLSSCRQTPPPTPEEMTFISLKRGWEEKEGLLDPSIMQWSKSCLGTGVGISVIIISNISSADVLVELKSMNLMKLRLPFYNTNYKNYEKQKDSDLISILKANTWERRNSFSPEQFQNTLGGAVIPTASAEYPLFVLSYRQGITCCNVLFVNFLILLKLQILPLYFKMLLLIFYLVGTTLHAFIFHGLIFGLMK